jgi:hypothetical protein
MKRIELDIVDSLAGEGAIVAVHNGWSAGKSFFPSGMIRRLDRVKFNNKWYKSAINHVYRKFTFESGLQIICESHFKGGVQINSYTKLLKAVGSGKVTKVFESEIQLTDKGMAELWNRYLLFEGAGYDKKLILLYYMWNRTGRKFDSLLSRSRKHKYTCNEIFVKVGKGIDPACMYSTMKDTPELLIFGTIGYPSALLPKTLYKYHRI